MLCRCVLSLHQSDSTRVDILNHVTMVTSTARETINKVDACLISVDLIE